MDIPALQRALAESSLDGWLLYDFHGQNPTALTALGLAGHMLTRRWFYLVPREGEPALLVHAIELGSFPAEVPGARRAYASWQSLSAPSSGGCSAALGPRPRIAMEYFPEAAIPYLSRVDAGTLEVVRAFGAEVVVLGRAGAALPLPLGRGAGREPPARARRRSTRAKDAAFARIGEALRRGRDAPETDVQRFLMDRFAAAGLETDHPPIVAVNGHAGDPHYEPSEATATPIRAGRPRAHRPVGARDRAARRLRRHHLGRLLRRPPAGQAPGDLRRHRRRRATSGWPPWSRRTGRAGRCQGWEVDRAVRDLIAARGFGERFVHRTGHSIGTSVHGDGANLDDLETHDTRAAGPRARLLDRARHLPARARGSGCGARSTCSSPPTGRRCSRRSSASSCGSEPVGAPHVDDLPRPPARPASARARPSRPR